jgi:hypothetical protein
MEDMQKIVRRERQLKKKQERISQMQSHFAEYNKELGKVKAYNSIKATDFGKLSSRKIYPIGRGELLATDARFDPIGNSYEQLS